MLDYCHVVVLANDWAMYGSSGTGHPQYAYKTFSAGPDRLGLLTGPWFGDDFRPCYLLGTSISFGFFKRISRGPKEVNGASAKNKSKISRTMCPNGRCKSGIERGRTGRFYRSPMKSGTTFSPPSTVVFTSRVRERHFDGHFVECRQILYVPDSSSSQSSKYALWGDRPFFDNVLIKPVIHHKPWWLGFLPSSSAFL